MVSVDVDFFLAPVQQPADKIRAEFAGLRGSLDQYGFGTFRSGLWGDAESGHNAANGMGQALDEQRDLLAEEFKRRIATQVANKAVQLEIVYGVGELCRV
jgi:hypothetical protein